MTILELKKEPGYIEAFEKIKKYSTGFIFTVYYSDIPEAKANALKILLRDCVELGLIESLSIGYDLDMTLLSEKYRRTEKRGA